MIDKARRGRIARCVRGEVKEGSRRVLLNSVVSKITTAFIVSGAALVATPSFANSAAADVSAPLRAAQEAKPAAPTGDAQFRKLFANWESLEKTSVPELAASVDAAPVSVRKPGRVNLVSGARVSGTLPFTGVQGRAMPFRSLMPFQSPGQPSVPSRTPIDGFRLTSTFGMREHPVLGGIRMHKGLDMAAPIGTPVHAAADGVVERADWSNGYGLLVEIDHGGSLETRYGHMSRLAVAAGQHVHKGDVVGYVGMTGRTTGPHLHYEVRVAGEAVNPTPYLQGGEMTARVAFAAPR